MPVPDGEAGLLGVPVLGEAWVPGQPASAVPGNEVPGMEDLERDAAEFAAAAAALALRWRSRTCRVHATNSTRHSAISSQASHCEGGWSLQPRTTPSVKYSQITRLTQR